MNVGCRNLLAAPFLCVVVRPITKGGPMRHRIKQTYSVQKDVARDTGDKFCTNRQQLRPSHLLHSDKNTCFYKSKLSGKGCFRKVQLACNFTKEESGSGPRPLQLSKVKTTVGRLIPLGLPIVSSLVLLLVLGMMINPVGIEGNTDKVYAVENEDPGIVPYTVPPDDGVSLTLNTTLPENETIEKEVSGSGAKYITVDFTVGAHNVDDYKVFVQADSTTLTGTSYQDAITSISTPTTATGMNSATKQWGYDVVAGANASMDSMTFKSIQTGVTTPAATVTGENGGKIVNHTQPYTLAFAANLDGAKADHYKSNITLSVAANAEEVAQKSFIGVTDPTTNKTYTYMQDVDKSVCNNLPAGAEFQLRDKRDEKIYWIGKLSDGLCWMTQNLDLDLKQGQVLTSVLSDTPSFTLSDKEGTLPSDTIISSAVWEWSDSSVRSYDPGVNIFLDGKTLSKAPDAVLTTEWFSLEDSGLDSSWTVTYDEYFVQASQFVGTDGISICSKTAGGMISDKNLDYPQCRVYYYEYLLVRARYDVHYMQGNYYSYGAATARSNTGRTTIDAPYSICPSGWKLPISRSGNSMWQAAGVTTAALAMASPNYYILAGRIISSPLEDVGSRGYYWSASSNSDNAYTFQFAATGSPNFYGNNGKGCGMSVRCVAR